MSSYGAIDDKRRSESGSVQSVRWAVEPVEEAAEHTGLLGEQTSSPAECIRRALCCASPNTTLVAVASLCNGIIGAGFMGLPFALKESGFLFGMVTLVVTSLLTWYSMDLLVRLAAVHECDTYQDVVGRAFGKVGYVVIQVAQCAFSFTTLVSYLLVVKEVFPPVLQTILGLSEPWNAQAVLAVLACVVVLPLSLVERISSVAVASVVGVLSVVFVAIAVVVAKGLTSVNSGFSPVDEWVGMRPGWLDAIDSIAFAFVCQHQLLLVFKQFSSPHVADRRTVIKISVLFTTAVTAVVAVAGYTLFWEYTRGNLFKSFLLAPLTNNTDRSFPIITAAQFLFGVNLLVTCPIEFLVCRDVLTTSIGKLVKYHLWQQRGSPLYDIRARQAVEDDFDAWMRASLGFRLHWGATAVLAAAVLGCSISLTELGIYQELSMSIGAVLIGFVFPAACHLKLGLEARAHDEEDPSGPCARNKRASIVLLLLGFSMWIASAAATLRRVSQGDPPLTDDPVTN
jgi:solute carrier family 38 (sodium-coupled neutral amino acid transporter), member 11